MALLDMPEEMLELLREIRDNTAATVTVCQDIATKTGAIEGHQELIAKSQAGFQG